MSAKHIPLALALLWTAQVPAQQVMPEGQKNDLIQLVTKAVKVADASETRRAQYSPDQFEAPDYLKLQENERQSRRYLLPCLPPMMNPGRGELAAKVVAVLENKAAANCELNDLDLVIRQWARMLEAKAGVDTAATGEKLEKSLSVYFDKTQPVYIQKFPGSGKTPELKTALERERDARMRISAVFSFSQEDPAKLARHVDEQQMKLILKPEATEDTIDSLQVAVARWRAALHTLRPLIGKSAK